MKTIKYVNIMLIAFVSIIGCSGNYEKLKTHSESKSKITQQELIDNGSDYNISFHNRSAFGLAAIVFDPKNDDRKILLGSNWDTVKDQKAWTEFVKANTTSDGDFNLAGGTFPLTQTRENSGVIEIWGPDNQQYGLIIYQKRWDFVAARMVDENTLRLAWRPPSGGNPAK